MQDLIRLIPRVLAICDDLGLHREAVEVPLEQIPEGACRIEASRLIITLPENDAEAWVESLPGRLRGLEGYASLQRADP